MVRQILFGLTAGALLSAMRAPAGLDLTQVPAADAQTAAFFRAGALAAIALWLDPRRGAFRGGVRVFPLGLALVAGFALHGLVVLTHFEPWCRLGFGLGLIGATLVLGVIAGRRGDPAKESGTLAELPSGEERLGLVLAGAGVAIALENLARHARLFTMGLREDDTLMALVFLVAAVLGAVAFGRPLAKPQAQRALVAGGASLTAGATLVGLTFIQGMEPDPLYNYLLRAKIDLTSIGTWKATALLTGAAVVVPGFLAGATLEGARQPRRLALLLSGAALGLTAMPFVVRTTAEAYRAPDILQEAWAWRVCVIGTSIAAVGALLILARPSSGPSPWPRRIGLAAAIVGIAMPLTGPRAAPWSFSPWYRVPISPILAMPIPEGMITVEGERGGEKVVTLDRRLLTPTGDELLVDSRRLRYALSLLPPLKPGRERLRVLFVGQMTPLRAFLLEQAADIDRTAPWFDAVEVVEAELFGANNRPRGDLVAPREARRRLSDGRYDLVIVAPARGTLFFPKSAVQYAWGATAEPVVGGLEVPEGTTAVVWLDAAAPLQARDLGEQVLLAQDRYAHLSVGVVLGDVPEESVPSRPALFQSGEPRSRPSALAMLDMRSDWRGAEAYTAITARLAEGNVGGEHEALARSLATHYSIQERSSPFSSRADQIQIGEEEIRDLFEASGGESLDAFTRSMWESVAWVLTEKRMIDLALVYLEPIAGRHGPWEPIDRGLAHAYREFDMAADALPLLERHLSESNVRLDLVVECAELASQAGDWRRAAEFWAQAAEVQPGVDEFRIEEGKALVRAGDPAGRAQLEALQEAHPEDFSIGPYLSEEGPPPFEPGYRPYSHLVDDAHDH